jgi:hypothetical protein
MSYSGTPRRLLTSKAKAGAKCDIDRQGLSRWVPGVLDRGTHARVTQKPEMESRRSCDVQERYGKGNRAVRASRGRSAQ